AALGGGRRDAGDQAAVRPGVIPGAELAGYPAAGAAGGVGVLVAEPVGGGGGRLAARGAAGAPVALAPGGYVPVPLARDADPADCSSPSHTSCFRQGENRVNSSERRLDGTPLGVTMTTA